MKGLIHLKTMYKRLDKIDSRSLVKNKTILFEIHLFCAKYILQIRFHAYVLNKIPLQL